ncbi:GNAT family N-acetyltransferase [Amycolatopsis sp. SID8362]|uniref:GNAT family N-acetyltransferase n=1 Tax=Amycolatopsis sp. SID8362 TaxID=2690346 RepID=UPI00136C590A|nr:GNAT family N-acetyltransferase [Amycolatopsis sp. SID8362]NBH02620.1 GNAT family N-acetyltransferase [Amycolatopsis sp. SID8362]NED39323.1 GNAT family N-acetyltransferase [Amycolatopsis sp. SID8362]
MSDVEIRPPRSEEYAAAGEVTVRAYDVDGHLAGDVGYDAVLRDVARRAEQAEVLVAVDGAGEVLGTVTVVLPGSGFAEISRPGELEFRMLAVAPSARGRGIGEALTKAVLDRARTLGIPKVVLSSVEDMRSAHRLYERLGFARLPERDWRPFPHISLIAYQIDV